MNWLGQFLNNNFYKCIKDNNFYEFFSIVIRYEILYIYIYIFVLPKTICENRLVSK